MGYPQKKQQARSYEDIRRIQELEDALQKATHTPLDDLYTQEESTDDDQRTDR